METNTRIAIAIFIIGCFLIAITIILGKRIDRYQVLHDDEEYCESCDKLKKRNKKCEYCGHI